MSDEPALADGDTFDTRQSKLTIVENDGRLVKLRIEGPGGIRNTTIPIAVVRKILSGEAQEPKQHREPRTPIPDTVLDEDFDWEAQAEYERDCALYRSLTDEQRMFIVAQWDHQHGLESPHAQLDYLNAAPHRKRQRNFWSGVLAVVGIVFIVWLSGLVSRDRQRSDDSDILDFLREQSASNPALKDAIEKADQWRAEQYSNE